MPSDVSGIQGLQFTQVDLYTTFRAEYSVDDRDIVFHFFLPSEMESTNTAPVRLYWTKVFPAVLEPVVYEVFKVQSPRVQAAYVHEMTSWWLRAYGFGEKLDPDGLCTLLFDALDKALDAVKKT